MDERPECRGRVVVVADQQMVADVLVVALANHGFDATSVDLADEGTLSAVLSKVLDDPPDALLLDLEFHSRTDRSLFIAPAVRAGVEVVVMTGNHEDAGRAVEAGARCLIPKTSPLADLIAALRSLLPGDPLLPAPA